MADSYGTQLDTMQQASQHVADVNQQVQAQLASLMSKLEPLASTWKGSAATSFTALHQRWNENATKLNSALHDISDAIATSRTTYDTSDTTQSSSFSNITSVLG
ncbi:WXG100 family type VII secretion target [Motilibacter rhizosphaerae]|uniref:ESAT-6-like protein n=1 Tax=Motilibacter rhizosphaerae TaxID=598652 RepID=A0A4Q7NT85_9ACTN|nr:WXG100 family type VII secretion target [Motilibacter rhizosphaerae]RZS90373.1 WXG100 family type VII secretion target [Motilibacter rhizosphaerae]